MHLTWGKFIIIEAVVLLALTAGICLLNPGYGSYFSRGVIARMAVSLTKGNISAGHNQGIKNDLDIDRLQPGDVILVGNKGCSYGHFSHTAIYIGNRQIMEGIIDTGVIRRGAARLRNYDYYAVLRPRIPYKRRLAAANYVRALENEPVWVAFKPGEQYWSCSKIPYTAYLKQGVVLDNSPDIIPVPDTFYRCKQVEIIQEGGL